MTKLVITGGTLEVQDAPLPPVVPPVPAPTAKTGTLVPLYTSPGHPSWAAVIAAKRAAASVPVLAIVNPNSGPGTAPQASYTAGISSLAAAGVRVLGYVATGYGSRPEATVRTDIDRWRSFYPAITALFLDEFGTAGKEDFYRSIVAYARGKGITLTVGNPGGAIAPSYAGIVDVLCIVEGADALPADPAAGMPDIASKLASWPTPRDPSKFAALAHGAPTLDLAWVDKARAQVGYIYVTADAEPNPWDSLSPYFPALMAALA